MPERFLRLLTTLRRGQAAVVGRLSAVILVVLLLGMLPMTGLLWLVAAEGREDAKAEAALRLTQAAQFAAAMQTDALTSVEHALRWVASRPTGWAEHPQSCIAVAREMVDHPFIAGMAMLRRDGGVICTANGPGTGVGLGDRDHIIEALKTGAFTVGSAMLARLSADVVIPVALRVADPNPGHDAVWTVTGTFDLNRIAQNFVRTMPSAAAADGTRIQVFDRHGTLLATWPPRFDGLVDEPPRDLARLLVAVGSAAAGPGVMELNGTDGRALMFGYARSADGGTIYAAVLPTDTLLAEAAARLERVLAMGLLAGGVGLALALLIAQRRILRPLDMLTELAAGAVSQTGSRPMRRLPGEFDVLRAAMATLLQNTATREHRLRAANRELVRLAERDALTGIANRRRFDTGLAEAWARATAEVEPVALIILDVDFFKKFNDRYGHLNGDVCLRKVAECLGQVRLRETDLAARFGGEEFVILLPRTEAAGALVVAERVLEAIRARMMLHEDGVDGGVTASAGVAACVPIRGMDSTALIAAADAALYAAKGAGRDQAVAASSIATPMAVQ